MKQLRKSIKKAVSCILCAGMMSSIVISSPLQIAYAGEADETITLRICNSEEYIDEGGWDEEIDLENIDAKYFEKRAKSYSKYFDKETGFMRGIGSDGKFRTPFNPFAAELFLKSWLLRISPFGI